MAEQPDSGPIEFHTSTFNDRVINFPPINHRDGPWVANSQCAYSDKPPENIPTDELK